VGQGAGRAEKQGRMAVYAYLLDTKLIELGSNQVGIVFKITAVKCLLKSPRTLK